MERQRLRVTGIVQGVGFRPHVHGLATALGLVGHVGNDVDGVFIEVEGPAPMLDEFARRVRDEAPPLAAVEDVVVSAIATTGDTRFSIAASPRGGSRRVLISPDVATCEDCRAEVRDLDDRRYGYPFTNCTNCGPRYTIIRDVPYDRPFTTMADFPLCADCAAEYDDPTNRRFHAQPVCCAVCGPHLSMVVGGAPATAMSDDDEVIADASARLRRGEVLAIKGLGGYHLAVLASHDAAVTSLRQRKHREEKPFALMVTDLAMARKLCRVDDAEAALLSERARPVVLLRRRDDAAVAAGVAPGNRSLGIMLPYTPLHDLLMAAVAAPLVMTSGNLSDEPIAHRDDDALRRLGPIADAHLVHDRPIHIRVDDSVARVVAGRPVILRRSRGYAPAPMRLPVPAVQDVLAVGAEQKNTVGLARGSQVFLSHHIGDLENWETLQSFRQAVDHVGNLFDVQPRIIAHDLHPEYLSTKHARTMAEDDPGLQLVGVQHHHAHIASCLADNDHNEQVIGVAFDGTGFGLDGTIWGGEFLVADLIGFDRAAHLVTVPMPGGVAAIREPWRMALAHLDHAHDGDLPDLEMLARNANAAPQVLAVLRSGLNCPVTSSMGRLFDAVSAIVGLCDTATYEGQAAIALEQATDPTITDAYEVVLLEPKEEGPVRLDVAELVRCVSADVQAGRDVALVGARFHGWVAAATTSLCRRLAEEHGCTTVALSGGVFQNALLVERVVVTLEAVGLEVLTHRQVPPNDGGIALGQAAVAAARGAEPS